MQTLLSGLGPTHARVSRSPEIVAPVPARVKPRRRLLRSPSEFGWQDGEQTCGKTLSPVRQTVISRRPELVLPVVCAP